ncbi:MAG TPA: 4-coumarate--CoA ligase [Alphaproteobacteria bacterium]|nr:4-coumarate--CoA ligase [Alphaproteobacteria bacterium]
MSASRWWQDRAALDRFVGDLLRSELGRLRPGSPPPAAPWAPAFRLDGAEGPAGALGADSLELMELASALNESLHMHRSGIEDYLLVRRAYGEWLDIAGHALGRFDAAVTFRTSGSTGAPKPCAHRLDALEEEAAALAAIFAGADRILAAVPGHHIYGFLFTILLPRRLGVAVVDIRDRSPAAVAGLARPGDLIVGHPEFWRALARAVPTLAPGVVGATSTAPCPAETVAALRAAGLSRLVEVYGSSETAGIGWRDDAAAPYRLFGHWRRGSGGLERDLAEAAAPEPDDLDWQDDRHFRVGGRHDRAVQVGGLNVWPQRVRAVLLEHPGVADAAVRLMRPEEGRRLKAFIVPRDPDADIAALDASLRAWIDGRLAVAERPRALSFGPALPRGAMGKAADWDIAA